MKKTILIIHLLFLFPLIGSAQLSIDSAFTQQSILQDTLPLGSNLNFNVRINNLGATPYSGTVYLVAGVDSSAGVTSIDTIGFINVVNFLSGNLDIPFNDNVLYQNGYRLGGNIVVVWPIANGLLPVDTFNTDIYVTEPKTVGLNEKENLLDKVSVYPNPINNELTIKKLTSDFYVKHVRIYTIYRELIYSGLYQENIDVSYLSKGTYLLELEFETSQRLVFKIIK